MQRLKEFPHIHILQKSRCQSVYLSDRLSLPQWLYRCLQLEVKKLWSCVVNLCTGKAWLFSANRIRTALLGDGKMDAKRSLVLLLAFCVEMLNYYCVFKRHKEEQEMRQWRWWFLSRLTIVFTYFWSCTVQYGLRHFWKHQQTHLSFLKNSTYDDLRIQLGVRSWSLFVNTVNRTPFEGTICPHSGTSTVWKPLL